MRLHKRPTAIALLLCIGSAVAAQPAPARPAIVPPARRIVDNVVLLEHTSDAFTRAPQWTLASAPLATAGGADAPDFDLTHVRAVAILSDGRIVTLSPVGNRL